MRTHLVLIFVISITFNRCASQASVCDTTYTVVDEMPMYKSGNSDLIRDIRENFKFDKNCKPEELRQLIWTIDEKGKVVNIDVVGLEGDCKNNITKQAKLLTDWRAGKLQGKPVCTKITIPIHIRPD
ncbi:MAG TPA: hypothetical protein VFU05_05275 [Cyclobacteriaceae bacterium]|nr:hypothetical protein [Cyclobacteriaceae bacterium]